MGQVGAWIEFYIIVAFDSSKFVWMVRVGYRLEFSVLVSVFFVRVENVPFLSFFCLSLSDSLELDYC